MPAGFRVEDTKRNSIGVEFGIKPEKNSGNSGADDVSTQELTVSGKTECLTKPRHGFRIGAAHHLTDPVRYVFGKGDSPDFSRACVEMLERRSMGDMSEYWTSSKMMAMRRGLEVGAMFEWGGLG